MPRINLGTTSAFITTSVLDDENGDTAIPSLTVSLKSDWFYASEAKKLGKRLIALAEQAEYRAKKRTKQLRLRKFRAQFRASRKGK